MPRTPCRYRHSSLKLQLRDRDGKRISRARFRDLDGDDTVLATLAGAPYPISMTAGEVRRLTPTREERETTAELLGVTALDEVHAGYVLAGLTGSTGYYIATVEALHDEGHLTAATAVAAMATSFRVTDTGAEHDTWPNDPTHGDSIDALINHPGSATALLVGAVEDHLTAITKPVNHRRLTLEELHDTVQGATERIAGLGGWPPHLRRDMLAARIPGEDSAGLGGFDAGVACALDMVPRNRQRLGATLHAAYTADAVAQVRREAADAHPDSATTWWLAACSVCDEGSVGPERFREQLVEFERLAADGEKRVRAAEVMFAEMTSSFEMHGDVAVAARDGGMQGAYIAGHDVAVMWSDSYKIWFIGTPEETLGLENFPWKDTDTADGPANSGPVGGSRQFVKACDTDELRAVIAAVRLSPDDTGGRRIDIG